MPGEVTQSHLERIVSIYVRQSSQSQVEKNKSSREVQYNLVNRPPAGHWRQLNCSKSTKNVDNLIQAIKM